MLPNLNFFTPGIKLSFKAVSKLVFFVLFGYNGIKQFFTLDMLYTYLILAMLAMGIFGVLSI